MKEQEKNPTTTEQTKPEKLTDEEISSAAGGDSMPAVVNEGVLAVPGKDSPLPQVRA